LSGIQSVISCTQPQTDDESAHNEVWNFVNEVMGSQSLYKHY